MKLLELKGVGVDLDSFLPQLQQALSQMTGDQIKQFSKLVHAGIMKQKRAKEEQQNS